jgi:hypothetical protein
MFVCSQQSLTRHFTSVRIATMLSVFIRLKYQICPTATIGTARVFTSPCTPGPTNTVIWSDRWQIIVSAYFTVFAIFTATKQRSFYIFRSSPTKRAPMKDFDKGVES